jgi:hypothetical protein
VSSSTLTPRVVVLSWLAALIAWPLVWCAQAAAQGVGVLLAGGEWIGVAVPLGGSPWGLVNEPGVSFAISRAALFGYWLAPLLASAALALLLAPFMPGSGGWFGELFVLQAAFAGTLLGLGWAPALGVLDGPAAGLARFWGVDQPVTVVVAAAMGAVATPLQVVRLSAPLWHSAHGPLRRRRLAVVVLHLVLPALVWVSAAAATGWELRAEAFLTVACVLVAALVAASLWVPRHPRLARPLPGWTGLCLVAVLAVVVAGAGLWAGAAQGGGSKALLWGRETSTSNVRPGMSRIPLTRPHDRPAQQAP